jgi:hypothetical protein
MREIRTSGSTRGERAARYVSLALLLYRDIFSFLLVPYHPARLGRIPFAFATL